jgi:hypothetical protein
MAATSTLLNYASAKQKANADSNAANFNAYVAGVNADAATQQATEEERQQRVNASQQIGQARANYGASGVSGSTGSALDVLQKSAENAELDALQIRHAGEMKSWAYKTGQAMDINKGDNARIAGNIAGAQEIVKGANSAITQIATGGMG